jgi:CDP-glucose 4,6-dehydratase
MEKISSFYKGKKILITGVTGFKGAWLCSWLIKLGAKVYGVGFSRNKNKKKLFYSLSLDKKISLRIFDIRNFEKIDQFIKLTRPSIIFHLAAQSLIHESYKNPFLTFDINSRGTLNILESSRKSSSVKSVVCVTSDKCFENMNGRKNFSIKNKLKSLDLYNASKASAELIIKSYSESIFKNKIKCGISIARSGNVIGGGDWSLKRLIPDCIRFIQKNLFIRLRNPNFKRNWQFILDPLKGYLMLGMMQYKNPVKYSGAWNFGPEAKSVKSVRKIVNLIIMHWGSGKIKIDLNINKFNEHRNFHLKINKTKKFLKWKPIYGINKSIKTTIEWYFQVLKNKKNPSDIVNDQIDQYSNDMNLKLKF